MMRPPPSGRRGGIPKQPPAAAPPVIGYGFPLMKVNEILEDMATFNFPIDASIIKAPKATDMSEILSFFLHEMYGEVIQKVLEPNMSSIENHPYPSMFDAECLAKFHFLKAVQRMFTEACYPDFCLTDLTTPDPKRFRLQLSALINYAKYRRSCLVGFEKLVAGEDEVARRHAALSQALEKLNAEIASIEQSRRDEEPAVAENNDIIEDLVKQQEQLNAQRIELTKETTTKKETFNALKERVSALEERVKRTKGEVIANKQLIVASPQRIQVELAERQLQLETTRNAIVKTQAERKGHDARERALREALRPLRVCEELAARVAEKHSDLAKQRGRLAQAENRERHAKDELAESQAGVNGQERLIDAINARRTRVADTRKEHEEVRRVDDERWAVEAEELRVFEGDCQDDCNRHRDDARRWMSECTAEANATAERLKELDEKHSALLNAVNGHETQVKQTLDMYVADCKEAFEKLEGMTINKESVAL